MRQYTQLALPIAVGLVVLCGCQGFGGASSGDDDVTCWGDPSPENTIEECVVFARADSPTSPGEGTRARPYTSLQTAIDTASLENKRVFACAGATFDEAIVLDAPIEVWGGFDCDRDWKYTSTSRSKVLGPSGKVAFTVSTLASGALVVGLSITAPDAEEPGGSAIAVAADRVEQRTSFWRCDFIAGDGLDGLDGDPAVGPAANGGDAPAAGQTGEATAACVEPAEIFGGAGATTACDDGNTIGGTGGPGGTPPDEPGKNGTDGGPEPGDNSSWGDGGEGQSDVDECKKGVLGIDGAEGNAGLGGMSKGGISLSGIVSVDGEPGKPGARGQGGGGGGGAKAGVFCKAEALTVEGAGASGGGGGAGGCGGKGGNPGRSGGSSIGIISLGGDVHLQDMTISTGRGGRGGTGAAGQFGGVGGKGASGGASSGIGTSTAGCPGGNGGAGGMGGPGGGGRGGHSVGIVYTQPPPSYDGLQEYVGQPGEGGFGGPGNEILGQGATGVRDEQRNFNSM